MKYKVWLSQAELLSIEVEADDIEQVQQKVDAHIYLDSLWKEPSFEMSEGCLEVHSDEKFD